MVDPVERWWNSVKDTGAFNGALTGLEWVELWPEAQEDIRRVYANVFRSLGPRSSDTLEVHMSLGELHIVRLLSRAEIQDARFIDGIGGQLFRHMAEALKHEEAARG